MDKPYGKLAEFFYGRAACALAYSLRNRADRWETDITLTGTAFQLINKSAGFALWIANNRYGLQLEKLGKGKSFWKPSFLGSFLVWSAVKAWVKDRNPAPDDEVLCRLALSE
jgi:hypothetical protein